MDNKFKNEKNFLSSYPDSISGVFDDKNIALAEKIASSAKHIELAGSEAFYTLFIKHIDF